MNTNIPAEQAVIGAAMLGNASGLLELNDDDFTDPRHQIIVTTIRDMLRSGRTTDPIQVNAELTARGQLSGLRGGVEENYVRSLAAPELTPIAAAAGFYAEAVRTSTRLRLTAAAAARLTRAASAEAASDDLEELIANHTEALNHIPQALDAAAPAAPATIADLLNMELTHDWQIPGLIEKGERVVVVAGEGGGKSVLSTQWAIAYAGGVHPFTGEPCGDPKRVLLIDAENGLRQTQRRYHWIGERFTQAQPGWGKRIQHHIHTEGLDLVKRDRSWFLKVAADCSPDLIILGPAYKLMSGDPQRDSEVMALLGVLDEVRTKHRASLFIETHTGHGKDTSGSRIVRPYGSSVWLRWPEIGIGLKRGPGDQGEDFPTEYSVDHWRGAREERSWPKLIERGTKNQLPWSPVGSDYWTTARRGLTK